MALTARIAALGTREEESSDVTNMRSALFSSVVCAKDRSLAQTKRIVGSGDEIVSTREGFHLACAVDGGCEIVDWRKMSDWLTRDHVITLLNSRWLPKYFLEFFLSRGGCLLLD